ncbi:MAG: GPW/gp25 family protein [Cyanobacteria bacterium P01_F01_bin.116]
MAQIYAREAIQKWEPRVVVEAVTAMPDDSRLNITLNYRIRESRHRRSLVYPFYLTPE